MRCWHVLCIGFKEKHGELWASGAAGDDDSSETSEDDDAEALTADVERDFFVTLAKLKGKNPEVSSLIQKCMLMS